MGNEIGNCHNGFLLELSKHRACKICVVQVVGVRKQVMRASFVFLQRVLQQLVELAIAKGVLFANISPKRANSLVLRHHCQRRTMFVADRSRVLDEDVQRSELLGQQGVQEREEPHGRYGRIVPHQHAQVRGGRRGRRFHFHIQASPVLFLRSSLALLSTLRWIGHESRMELDWTEWDTNDPLEDRGVTSTAASSPFET